MAVTFSNTTQRRFILGKQGLFPGRRWLGKEGTAQAIAAGSVVQIDPLNIVARNHDIVLYGRVLEYRPSFLEELLYTDHRFFDWGGTVMVHLMEELPYWRVVMARKQLEDRRARFAAEYSETIDAVFKAIIERGPLGARDLKSAVSKQSSFRSGKITSQALYYLWMAGELMTHSRRGFDRIYDLRDRVVPADLNYAATPEEADNYFAVKVFHRMGILTERSWRNWFSGTIERKVAKAEAAERLAALRGNGSIARINLEAAKGDPHYVLAEDVPLLEALQAGNIPDEWYTLDATTGDEVVFLGPLEIVSARGRALTLFDFEYVWEVYKPQQKRRWGYYVLPILYNDRLVARIELRLDRESRTLRIDGFWLEDHVSLDDGFVSALGRGLQRFLGFLAAESIVLSASFPPHVSPRIAQQLADLR